MPSRSRRATSMESPWSSPAYATSGIETRFHHKVHEGHQEFRKPRIILAIFFLVPFVHFVVNVLRVPAMQLGMIGLGRMGGNMVLRLLRAGHDCVAFDRDPEKTRSFDAEEKKKAAKASSVADVVKQLKPPRAVWVMLPAGKVTEDCVNELAGLLQSGDAII